MQISLPKAAAFAALSLFVFALSITQTQFSGTRASVSDNSMLIPVYVRSNGVPISWRTVNTNLPNRSWDVYATYTPASNKSGRLYIEHGQPNSITIDMTTSPVDCYNQRTNTWWKRIHSVNIPVTGNNPVTGRAYIVRLQGSAPDAIMLLPAGTVCDAPPSPSSSAYIPPYQLISSAAPIRMSSSSSSVQPVSSIGPTPSSIPYPQFSSAISRWMNSSSSSISPVSSIGPIPDRTGFQCVNGTCQPCIGMGGYGGGCIYDSLMSCQMYCNMNNASSSVSYISSAVSSAIPKTDFSVILMSQPNTIRASIGSQIEVKVENAKNYASAIVDINIGDLEFVTSRSTGGAECWQDEAMPSSIVRCGGLKVGEGATQSAYFIVRLANQRACNMPRTIIGTVVPLGGIDDYPQNNISNTLVLHAVCD